MTARRAIPATILILLSLGASAAPRRASHQLTATVLCYHIVEAPAAPRMHIDRETFRQQIRYIEMTGYNVIPLQHLDEYVRGERASLPENAIVLTFDDGWSSTYTEVFPELQRRGFPFTVFIYPNIIGKTANALSWAQIREMADAGVDIQSHSLSHGYLTRKRHRSKSEAQYQEWLRRELRESRKILEEKTGRNVRYLAYPYGDFDDSVARAAKESGYRAALTCEFGPVERGSDPHRMKRVVIDDRMDFAAFRRHMGTKPLQLAEMTPTPGRSAGEAVTRVAAKIAGFDSLDPRSVGMALLSLGTPVPYSYDARTGAVSLVLRNAVTDAKKKTHRALVWGTDRQSGKRVEATWVFRLGEEPQMEPRAEPQLVQPAPAAAIASTSASAGVAGGVQRR